MTLLFQPNQKLLFIGDSITDCGRRGDHSPYGHGYVRRIQEWLGAVHPELNLSIVNKGISGNTIRDLIARWGEDVTAEQPDWLFIKIGVNDMWRFVTDRLDAAVPVEEYKRHYQALLDDAQSRTDAQIMLIEPFLAEPDLADGFRGGLDQYRLAVRHLAETNDLPVVKLQDAVDAGLAHQPFDYWTTDRVHPTPIGHTLIAREVLKACGFAF
jgi:lysophospholipase L1-like esterase